MNLLFVTDQPFWRRANGAHQRTWSLLAFLRSKGIATTVFFMVQRTEEDVTTCQELKLDVLEFETGRSSWLSVVAGRLLHRSSPQSGESPLTLDSYRWPQAIRQFDEIVRQRSPDVVLFDYVIWTSLLEPYPRGDRPFRAAVNTHDLLYRRCEQFRQNGKQHWIEITQQQESVALSTYDLILAIQHDEASAMQAMAPQSKVIVAGHCCDDSAAVRFREMTPNSAPRIGFVGSHNLANVDGLNWFLRGCWTELRDSCRGIELWVAGDVGRSISKAEFGPESGVKFLGHVDRLEDFYDQVDFTINPVRFGSGLKIKTIESIHFATPVVTHPHGAKGLSSTVLQSVDVAETESEFIDGCRLLAQNHDQRQQRVVRLRQIAASELSPDSVHGEFDRWIKAQMAD